MSDQLSEIVVSAIIAASSVNVAAPSGTITYWADVRMPDGTIEFIEIGRPETEFWPPDGPWVYPLPVGTRIYGTRRGSGDSGAPGEFSWQYVEKPRMRLCAP